MVLKNIDNFFGKSNNKLSQIQFLTGNAIKIIAICSMFINHFCIIILQYLLSEYWFKLYEYGKLPIERFQEIDNFIRFDLQSIGVIAFPIFCFLLSEGFRYTRNRKRYIGVMLLFALISELPFDIGFFSRFSLLEHTFPFYFDYQNVFFTLFLGLVGLMFVEKIFDRNINKVIAICINVCVVAVIALIAELIHCDYGAEGVIYISIFYIFSKNRIYQGLLFLLAYILITGCQPSIYVWISILVILLYNGKRGKLKIKYFFYAFYPVHIIVLYFVTLILNRILV